MTSNLNLSSLKDCRCGVWGVGKAEIHYMGFSIYFTGPMVYGSLRVGLPGVFTAYFPDATFYGSGSFYNHLDVVK